MSLIKKIAQIAILTASLTGVTLAQAEQAPATAPAKPTASAPATAPAKPAEAPKKGVSAPVDINKATEAELQKIPGVGPAKAKAIIEHRTKNGPFKTIDDLKKVKGIGDKIFESMKPNVKV